MERTHPSLNASDGFFDNLTAAFMSSGIKDKIFSFRIRINKSEPYSERVAGGPAAPAVPSVSGAGYVGTL
jgi:hypothetical protein